MELRFKKPGWYAGRNGLEECVGVDTFVSKASGLVSISPINSKGCVAGCYIEVPVESLDELINMLAACKKPT
jgi:hypothetical protein